MRSFEITFMLDGEQVTDYFTAATLANALSELQVEHGKVKVLYTREV